METTQYASEQSVKTNNQKVISKRARSRKQLACAADETSKLWLSLSTKQRKNPCSGHPLVYQDLSTRYDWPV